MQSEGKLLEGTPKRYPTAFKAYSIIAQCAPSLATGAFRENAPCLLTWGRVAQRGGSAGPVEGPRAQRGS